MPRPRRREFAWVGTFSAFWRPERSAGLARELRYRLGAVIYAPQSERGPRVVAWEGTGG